MVTEQRELWFQAAETNVWRSPSAISIEKRPVFLLWLALAEVAASCAFFAFNQLRQPAAAEQQFTGGITRVLFVIAVAMAVLALAQTFIARLRFRAILDLGARRATLAGRAVPLESIVGFTVSDHIGGYLKLSAAFAPPTPPFLLVAAPAARRDALDALGARLSAAVGLQPGALAEGESFDPGSSRALTLMACAIGTVWVILGLTWFRGLGFRSVFGTADTPGLPAWTLGLPCYGIAVASWWTARARRAQRSSSDRTGSRPR